MSLSLFAIFGAGLLTFASPCVLPLIPIYLSVLAGATVDEVRSGARRGRVLGTSAAFVLGVALVFVAMGMAASATGRALAAHRGLLLQVGGLAAVLFGLKLLGVLRLPWLEREFRPGLSTLGRGGGLLGAFLFGAAFALGWTPCIGPVLGAVLTYTAGAAASPWAGAGYLSVYAAGLAVPLLVTAAIAPRALGWLRRAQTHLRKVEVATGVAMALTGVLLMTDSLGLLSAPAPAPVAAVVGRATPAPCDGADAGAGVTCGLPAGPNAPSESATADLPPEPQLVEFVSGGCTVCRRMAPVVRSVERECGGVSVRPIDVGSPSGRALARRLGVLGVPTFLALDGAGRERDRLVGEQPRERLVRAVESLLDRRCAGPPLARERVALLDPVACGAAPGGC